jgi:hypothetical protein
MSFDDGYETDDTDELLARKMSTAPMLVYGMASQNRCHERDSTPSCVVDDDWLFSIDGEPNLPSASGAI